MASKDIILRLHEHRNWVNSRLIDAVGTLSDSQLKQRFVIGQGSVWKTLTHLYAAEYVWLEALLGDECPVAPGDAPQKLPGNQEGENAMTSFAELRERWKELDLRWKSFLNQLTEESLSAHVCKTSSLSGKRSVMRKVDILLHLCTHAQYTTAQLINMLRQLGVQTLPDTMLITMAREESA